jgi:hypothetical protein
MQLLGAHHFVPFASMHKYQREDSVWANEYATTLSDFSLGFDPAVGELLPAFIRYDCIDGSVHRLDPPENAAPPLPPEAFGDDWSEQLTDADEIKIRDYFTAIGSLAEVVDTVTFRVGGRDTEVVLGTATGCAVLFEVPRNSLMSTVEWEIFDDLLIGNFMKTTLFGPWTTRSLRPDFTARIAKYADNGRAFSHDEVERYRAEYHRRAPVDQLTYEVRRKYAHRIRSLARLVRSRVSPETRLGRAGSAAYARARR